MSDESMSGNPFAKAEVAHTYRTEEAVKDGALRERSEQPLTERTAKFDLGRLVITPGAAEVLQTAGLSPHDLLCRHQAGDWGEVNQPDWEANEQALKDGDRLLSRYSVRSTPIWVITEDDRSLTTILRPEEY